MLKKIALSLLGLSSLNLPLAATALPLAHPTTVIHLPPSAFFQMMKSAPSAAQVPANAIGSFTEQAPGAGGNYFYDAAIKNNVLGGGDQAFRVCFTPAQWQKTWYLTGFGLYNYAGYFNWPRATGDQAEVQLQDFNSGNSSGTAIAHVQGGTFVLSSGQQAVTVQLTPVAPC